MASPVVFLTLALSSLMTVYLVESMWRGRAKIPCMTGMMVAMTAGMITGLIAGTVAAVVMKGPLWPPSLAGMLIGMMIGAAIGAPISLMAVLDGGQAGLMGGLMGAMLGAMAPEAITSISVFLAATYLAGTVAVVRILRGEGGGGPPGRWRRLAFASGRKGASAPSAHLSSRVHRRSCEILHCGDRAPGA